MQEVTCVGGALDGMRIRGWKTRSHGWIDTLGVIYSRPGRGRYLYAKRQGALQFAYRCTCGVIITPLGAARPGEVEWQQQCPWCGERPR